MGVREKLNKSPIVAILIVAVAVIASGSWLYSYMSNSGQMDRPKKAYYTVDDGKTTFIDAYDRICPFDRDGKEAVRAHVYTCDGGKTTFVGCLEKFSPEFKTKAEQALADRQKMVEAGKTPPPAGATDVFGVLVKKPGGDQWYPSASQYGTMAASVACPAGGVLEMQFP